MNPTPNKYLTIGIIIILLSLHFFTSDRVEAQSSADFFLAGTWQNVTTTQNSSTRTISGRIYTSRVFEGVSCPDGSGGHSTTYFGGIEYDIFNSSGTKVREGLGVAGQFRSGSSCATDDNYVSAIYDFQVNADISGLPPGNYQIMLETGPMMTNLSSPGPTMFYQDYFTIASSCSITSFTCSTNAELSWITSNCTNRNITPSIGNVSASGSTNGSAGTTYTLTADTIQSIAYCPAPYLDARWSANNSTTYSRTLTQQEINQGWADVLLNYDNTGDTGSCVNNIECIPSPTGAATNAQAYCEVKTICK
jgi:hypothetical protein